MNWLQREITVANQRGVHARLATAITALTSRYDGTLRIVTQEGEVDCSSALDILSRAFVHGSRLCFQAAGREAHVLLDEVAVFLDSPEDPAQ